MPRTSHENHAILLFFKGCWELSCITGWTQNTLYFALYLYKPIKTCNTSSGEGERIHISTWHSAKSGTQGTTSVFVPSRVNMVSYQQFSVCSIHVLDPQTQSRAATKQTLSKNMAIRLLLLFNNHPRNYIFILYKCEWWPWSNIWQP